MKEKILKALEGINKAKNLMELNDLLNFKKTEEYKELEAERAKTKEETKTDWRTIVIWGLVLDFLFFRKKKRNRFNFGHGPKGR